MRKNKSELRQDLVSGDWIVVSPKRGSRPDQFLKKGEKRKASPKATCPFENPQSHGNEKPILVYGSGKDWQLQVIENKFPAFTHQNKCGNFTRVGPYLVTETVGHHDLVITRNHVKNFSRLSRNEAQQVFEAFRDRYLMLLNDKCVSYLVIFHNWGPKAGASVFHPHYQMIALPIIPPDVMHSFRGSFDYFKKTKKCVHCVMLDFEKKHKKRIVYENKGAIAFAPFVSKNPFEVRIFPKKHLAYFENTLDVDIDYAVEALQKVLVKIEKNLKDPDYNFFIHTAPIKDKNDYKMYHWHMEVIPKSTLYAGFELGTGMEINVIDPDQAAKILRK